MEDANSGDRAAGKKEVAYQPHSNNQSLIVLGMLTGKMSLPSITTAKSAWVIGQRKECICHEMLVYFVQKTLIDFKLSSITNNKEQHEQRGKDWAHKRTCGCSYAWKKWELVFHFSRGLN
ncbi:hypothetical protein ACR9GP_25615 [Enterobacter ludwigii]